LGVNGARWVRENPWSCDQGGDAIWEPFSLRGAAEEPSSPTPTPSTGEIPKSARIVCSWSHGYHSLLGGAIWGVAV
jgi:hypothetical protein